SSCSVNSNASGLFDSRSLAAPFSAAKPAGSDRPLAGCCLAGFPLERPPAGTGYWFSVVTPDLVAFAWQGQRESNPQPSVLETDALPVELYPYANLRNRLLDDLRHHAGADGAAAFTDGEAQAFFHGDRGDQLHGDRHVVARHHHLLVLGQLDGAGDVGGAEVELRPVVVEERRVTPALFLAQHVDLGREVRVRLDRAGLAQHLAALDFLALGAAQQNAHVVARLALVQQLAEHLHAGAGGLLRRADADDLDFLANLDHAALDAARDHGAAAGDREHVFDRHQERAVDGTLGCRDVAVQRVGQAHDRLLAQVTLVAFHGQLGAALDDRGVVAREVVLAEQLAHFHLDELEQLGVVDHVALVQEHDDVLHAHLARQQDVLARLRHRAVRGRAHQDRAVHLRGTRDHVL